MTRIDRFVVGTLVTLFAIIAALVAGPAFVPAASSAAPSASRDSIVSRPYREGVVGHPVSISPLSARSQADRDLVALIFSGLVKDGPSGTLLPDLAESWTVDPSGATWTFELRPDARWHDGEPVTAEDVAFTIRTLQDPAYTGPAAGSWNDVTVLTVGSHTVAFTVANPLGGFLQAATQPIAPAHLLGGVAVEALAGDPFAQRPIGSGPFALVRVDAESADLVPAALVLPDVGPAPQRSSIVDSLATPAPTARSTEAVPYLAGIQFRYFDDPAALAAAYRRGDLDGASGLPSDVAGELAAAPGSRVLRYPGSTLTAVLFNLRPDRHVFTSPALRTAFLAAIDRPALIGVAYAGVAGAANGPIPPSSPLFDPAAADPVGFSTEAAQKALKAAGWTKADNAWRRSTDKRPLTFELLSPDAESNPGLNAAAAAVAADWKFIGIQVTHVPLPPGEFVSRVAAADFTAVVADIRIGLDPDLYPLLASSQTLTGGSNVLGLQDPALDKLLVAARKPASPADRASAYSALQVQLAKGQYLLPLAFADDPIVVRDTLLGPRLRQVADRSDRFWDVLTWRLAADR